MNPFWKKDLLQALEQATTESQIMKELVPIAHALGFDYCAYGLSAPLPLTRPKIMIFSNYPSAWQQQYKLKNYYCIDPTVQRAKRTVSPVIWSEEVFAATPEFWEEARSFGLVAGLAQPSIGVNGIGSLLTLARSGENVSAIEWESKAMEIMWLSQMALGALSHVALEKFLPETEIHLSDREVEVLRWTGDGKTAGEVAGILGITERTVNFHISNAISKLRVNNKTVAVLRAAMLGIL